MYSNQSIALPVARCPFAPVAATSPPPDADQSETHICTGKNRLP